jgi:hypothetical protein
MLQARENSANKTRKRKVFEANWKVNISGDGNEGTRQVFGT